MLKFLHLECGLDFNNMSALQLAAKHGHVHILRCIREVINFTADDFCIENNKQDFQKIIRNAAEHGYLNVLEFLKNEVDLKKNRF